MVCFVFIHFGCVQAKVIRTTVLIIFGSRVVTDTFSVWTRTVTFAVDFRKLKVNVVRGGKIVYDWCLFSIRQGIQRE